MPSMKATVEALKEAGLQGKVKVIIGGAPVTQKYADEIGADGYGRDAAAAANLVKKLHRQVTSCSALCQAPAHRMAGACALGASSHAAASMVWYNAGHAIS